MRSRSMIAHFLDQRLGVLHASDKGGEAGSGNSTSSEQAPAAPVSPVQPSDKDHGTEAERAKELARQAEKES